jgi:hypothetical protein
MRSKLLVSTAALLAGMAMASAQNVPSGGRDSGPAAQSQGAPGGAAGQDRQAPQSSQGQQGQDAKGQAQQGQKDQMQPGQQKDQAQSPSQTQQSPKQEQSPQRQQGQQGQGAQPGQGAQGKTTQQGQTQQGQTGGTLTTEQRTKVRETVLTGGNVPRASNVNFSISVGTAVPRTVRVVAVPSTLVEFHPQWRGYRYFVVGDDMIIVDRNNRIVAVIAL